ncbi:MAG: hypothetical protein K1X75_15945 [Leptospirales bacterium]|nr:hypothetical protein [Leptospirales bacterium]
MVILRNILAVVGGLVLGSVVNMGLIMIGPHLIAPPPGADLSTEAGLAAAMSLFEPRHFIFPFLAHALGSLAGAFLAARIAAKQKLVLALLVGAIFLLGGIYMIVTIPSPLWFALLDLIGAYIPMAYLGARLFRKSGT